MDTSFSLMEQEWEVCKLASPAHLFLFPDFPSLMTVKGMQQQELSFSTGVRNRNGSEMEKVLA